jgi:hypothetical protein
VRRRGTEGKADTAHAMITISPSNQSPSASPPAPQGPLELYVCPFTILESSAEQHPWTFQNIVFGGQQWIVKRKRQYLKTADYSIEGFEDRILVERKADDFISSITTERRRFENEHERMKAVVDAGGFCCVIVENSLAAICDELDDPNSGRRVSSDTVIGTVATMPRRSGVHWIFAGDRRRAELVAFKVLWKWWSDEAEKGSL